MKTPARIAMVVLIFVIASFSARSDHKVLDVRYSFASISEIRSPAPMAPTASWIESLKRKVEKEKFRSKLKLQPERKIVRPKPLKAKKTRRLLVFSADHLPTPKQARAIAWKLVQAYGWVGEEWRCLDRLWDYESSWSVTEDNPTSDAYGIPQSLPGEKMATEGSDWRWNPWTQIRWGLKYIKDRYLTPCRARAHSLTYDWY